MEGLTTLLINAVPFIVMIGVMYFLIIRPQQKQVKKTQSMLQSLAPGDAVSTIGGLHGVIDEINDDTEIVVLDCEGVYLTFDRRAIGRVIEKNGTVVSETSTEDINTEA